jgi:hypothetical protein
MGAVLNEILRPVAGSRSGERPRIVSTGEGGTADVGDCCWDSADFLAGEAVTLLENKQWEIVK